MKSLHKDLEYLSTISSNLRNFKQVDSVKFRCSCPICGDSKKDPRKARGGFTHFNNSLWYGCFNCGYKNTFENFLKDFDLSIYNQYMNDKKNDYNDFDIKLEKKKVEYFTESDKYLIFNCILQSIKDSKQGLEYCQSRKIPEDKYNRLYYIDDIREITKLSFYYRDKFTVKNSCIVMPVYNTERKVSGLICRGLDKISDYRYLTLAFDNYSEKVFGYGENELNLDKTIYCLEGAFDSLFIDNAVAVNTSALNKIRKVLPTQDIVFVFDNQYDNKELVNIMIKEIIDKNEKLVIWSKGLIQKDVNDMILAGIDNVEEIIKNNIHQGESALYLLRLRQRELSRTI